MMKVSLSICFCLLPVLGWSLVSLQEIRVSWVIMWPQSQSECLDSVQVVTAGDIWGHQPQPSNDNKSENKIHGQPIFLSLSSPLEVVGWVKLLYILTTAGLELWYLNISSIQRVHHSSLEHCSGLHCTIVQWNVPWSQTQLKLSLV